MERDFKIGQSNELIKEGVVYDIHNMYDFLGIEIGSGRVIRILFGPNVTYGMRCPLIALSVYGVQYFEVSPGFGTRVISDVDELGYKRSSDRDDVWLLTEQQATIGDHLYIRFVGDDFIRICGEKSCLEVLGC